MLRFLPPARVPCFSRASLAIFSRPPLAVLALRPRPRPSRKMSTAAAEGEQPRAPATESVGGDGAAEDTLVQYVVVRRDLVDTWPLGSVVAQGCHAAVAAVWVHRAHPDTAAYLTPDVLDSMHKVTLEVKGEAQLKNLAEKLRVGGIDHKLWIEQPEDIPTCIATRPYRRLEVASYFKKLKLCK